MIHKVNRTPQPADSVTLTVSPQELLGMHRALARIQPSDYTRSSPSQKDAEMQASDMYALFRDIDRAARDAGIVE